MRKAILLIAIIVCFLLTGFHFQAGAEVIDQNSKTTGKKEFKTYEIGQGETLSEIAWVLGISMKELTKWNSKILKQGIRNLQPGTTIKYKTSEQISEQVENSQEKTREEIRELQGDIRQKRAKMQKKLEQESSKTKGVVRSEGKKTRSNVHQEGSRTRDKLDSVEKSLSRQIHSQQSSLLTSLFLVMIVIILLCGILIYSKFRQENNKESQEESASEEGQDKVESEENDFDPKKLKELQQVQFKREEGEEQFDFELNGYQFSALVQYDPDRGYRCWEKSFSSGDRFYRRKRKDAKNTVKTSLKQHLSNQELETNKTKEEIDNGKLKRTN